MRKAALLIILTWSIVSFAQIQDTTLTQEDQELYTTFKADFINTYELKDKKPIMARITDEFEMRSEPSCASDKTGVIIPQDSIAFVYKFFPKEKCWATNYHGQWGFIADSKVFPISSKTRIKKIKFDTPPQLKSGIKPKYPKKAKKAGITGKVYIKVYIDENGKATKTIILKGHEALRQASIDAVKKAKYKAAKLEGEDIGVWVTLSLNFK